MECRGVRNSEPQARHGIHAVHACDMNAYQRSSNKLAPCCECGARPSRTQQAHSSRDGGTTACGSHPPFHEHPGDLNTACDLWWQSTSSKDWVPVAALCRVRFRLEHLTNPFGSRPQWSAPRGLPAGTQKLDGGLDVSSLGIVRSS